MDTSGSIRADRFVHVKNFINGVVEQLEVSDDKARYSNLSFFIPDHFRKIQDRNDNVKNMIYPDVH